VRLVLPSLSTMGAPEAASCLAAFVEALVQVNGAYLQTHRAQRVVELYRSGVRYEETPSWMDIPALLSAKRGDCKSLVAWRVAELRARGEQAFVHIVYVPHPQENRFHIQVRRSVDVVEDPSRMLGMK